jgi:hypothetical protein
MGILMHWIGWVGWHVYISLVGLLSVGCECISSLQAGQKTPYICVHMYIIYTPNLGTVTAVFVLGGEHGLSNEGAGESSNGARGSIEEALSAVSSPSGCTYTNTVLPASAVP